MSSRVSNSTSRREFLKTISTITAGTLLSSLSIARSAYAAVNDLLRIGLVGCGSSGSGAALDALNADKHVKLVSLGDLFADRIDSSLTSMTKQAPRTVRPTRLIYPPSAGLSGLMLTSKSSTAAWMS